MYPLYPSFSSEEVSSEEFFVLAGGIENGPELEFNEEFCTVVGGVSWRRLTDKCAGCLRAWPSPSCPLSKLPDAICTFFLNLFSVVLWYGRAYARVHSEREVLVLGYWSVGCAMDELPHPKATLNLQR